ncbi:MAG: YfhO family protein [Planctomycetes bacterium]|nr:YfhO family protein [Planctomycetota bacterium]
MTGAAARRQPATAARLAALSLLLAPLLWLWPSVSGARDFVPYSPAQYPPLAAALTAEQTAAAADGANTDVTEVPVWFLPELELAQRELRAGRLPTWDPHARFGAPLHAHGLVGLCYPPNWLALLAPAPARALVYVAWLNLALGGLLAFGLLRAVGLSSLGAWLGALLFELSGPMAANAFFWMRLGAYVWLPGVLWAAHALVAAERLRVRHVAALAFAFAMPWLAGFPPFAATTTLLGLLYAGWRALARWRQDGRRAGGGAAGRLLLGFALGGMLALPQVLPSLQFFPHSARPTKPAWQDLADQPFERYGLLGFVLPDAIGHPSDKAAVPYGPQNVLGLLHTTRTQPDGKAALPNWNWTEYAVFVSQFGLVLALVGALAGRGRGRGFAVGAWLLCAALALFVPGVRALFLMPLLENVWPMRWLAPATLFVTWLAAIGLERLRESGRALPLAGALLIGGFAAWLAPATAAPAAAHAADRAAVVQQLAAKYQVGADAVIGHVQAGAPAGVDRAERAFARLQAEGERAAWACAGVAVWLLLWALLRSASARTALAIVGGCVAALQLAEFGGAVTTGVVRGLPAESPVHAFLREQARARAADGGFTFARGGVDGELPAQLPPGQVMVPGARDLQFYSHFDGRTLQPLQRLLGAELGKLHAGKGYLTAALPHTLPTPTLAGQVARGEVRAESLTPHPFASPLLDLFGVRFVLSVGAPLPRVGERVAIAGAPADFVVQERASALPRAFAVASAQGHATDDDVIAALLQPDFAPRRAAHTRAADLPANVPAAADAAAPPRAVAFAVDQPTRIELDVAAGAQPWLLLADAFLPGWRATVDGKAATIHRADHGFRLVQLPPTACRVVFAYRAPGLAGGAAAAVAALAALAALAWRQRRRNTAQERPAHTTMR